GDAYPNEQGTGNRKPETIRTDPPRSVHFRFPVSGSLFWSYPANGNAATVALRPSGSTSAVPASHSVLCTYPSAIVFPSRRERAADVIHPASGLAGEASLVPAAGGSPSTTRPTRRRLMWPRLVARAITSWPR